MSEEQSIGHDMRTRILALMPQLHARHAALVEVLEAMAREEDVPLWKMDLARADVFTVLTLIHPTLVAQALATLGDSLADAS